MAMIFKLRYFLGLLIIAYCAFVTNVFAKPSKEQITVFVTSLSNQVIDVLKNNENNISGRKAGFEDIFQKAGDVSKIARFVAGAAWKNASGDIQQNYVEIYRQYMAYTYASRITQYNNQQVKIGRISDLGSNGFLVNTMLVTPNTNNAMSVIWQLSSNDDTLKVTDLRVENISMSLTQRAEFAAYLMMNKNDLGQLAGLLQTRLNTLK
jgi:phospholipid transport system substrate-binding protein